MARVLPLPLALILLLLPARALAGAALVLDGAGGDAWTFRKAVHGTVTTGGCNEIRIRSSGAIIAATQNGRRFTATVPLQAGDNALRAICQQASGEIAISPPQHWIEKLRDAPEARIDTVPSGNGIVLDGSRSKRAPGHAAPLSFRWSARPGNPAPLRTTARRPLEGRTIAGARLALALPPTAGDYFITLRAIDTRGRSDASTIALRVTPGGIRALDEREPPAWARDAVIYGAVPALFGKRGLADVTARLDQIAALGATVLWLSPITAAPAGDFGYAVTDHFRVNPALGSAADLRALVAAAHARRLKVVLDVAVNDLSDRHPYYRDFLRHSSASSYAGFFDRDTAGAATHYFDWKNLENLNYANAEVRSYAIEAFARWVRDFDVDGFRVDAAWGVARRAPDFWPAWRRALKRIKPDLLLIAEAPAREDYAAQGFDAAYDWTEKLGEWAWQEAFAGPHTARRLRPALEASLASPTRVLRFLDDNDTGARFITRYGIGRLRVAAAMLFTLPGLPCLYMGDEVGAAFLPYGPARPIDWTDRFGLRAYYTELIALRHREPALRSPEMRLLSTSSADDVLAYLRRDDFSAASLVVLLNFAAEPRSVALNPEEIAEVQGDGRMVDLLNGDAVTLQPGAPSLTLPAFSARILRRAGG